MPISITMSIYSIAKIEAAAIAATARYSTAKEACPYPLDTIAAYTFKKAFEAERQRQEDAIQNAAAIDIKTLLNDDKAGLHQ